MLGRPDSLRSNQLDVELICDPAGNFVLQGKQIAHVAVQPLRPQMRVGLGVDQLDADADLAARPPDASFEHIAHSQLTTNLSRINIFVPVGKSGISRDHEHTYDTG